MAEPFIGEIRIVSFGFAPKGWAHCNGQLLPISQNQALFSLLGTSFGGDGRVNFSLPDNRGKVPMHVGNGHTLSEQGGNPSHTLSINEIPIHTHRVNAHRDGNTINNNFSGTGSVPGSSNPGTIYNQPSGNLVALHPGTVANVGNSQAHNNMQPFLTLNFCIALAGDFPPYN